MWKLARSLSMCAIAAYGCSPLLCESSHGFALRSGSGQDRVIARSVLAFDATFAAVISGTANGRLTLLLQSAIQPHFEMNYAKSKGKEQQKVSEALLTAFDALEESLLSAIPKAAKFGFPKVVYSGATVICAVATENFYVVANTGDNMCVLVTEKVAGKIEAAAISRVHTLKNEQESSRLRRALRRDPQLSSLLPVTRAFGLFHLKHKEFNNPWNYSEEQGFAKPIDNFAGPYVTHQPDIVVKGIQPEDRFLILGSRNFWNLVDVGNLPLILSADEDPQELASKLLTIAQTNSIARNPEFKSFATDDISVVIVKLRKN